MEEKTPMREICEEYGLSRADLSRKFKIPLRTLENWLSGVRNPPVYVVEMIRTILEHERKNKRRRGTQK